MSVMTEIYKSGRFETKHNTDFAFIGEIYQTHAYVKRGKFEYAHLFWD